VDRFRERRDEFLVAAAVAHREAGWVTHDYAVTAGDEFQNIVTGTAYVPTLVFDLRRRFRPLDLRIAIGVGRVASLPTPTEPVNIGGTGEAFERAREAMDSLRGPTFKSWQPLAASKFARKYRSFTALRTGVDDLDVAVNIIYRLLDSLLRRTTDRQWETINAYEQHHRLDRAAEALEVDESTVSRNLNRSSYWQALDAMVAVEQILRRLDATIQNPQLAPRNART